MRTAANQTKPLNIAAMQDMLKQRKKRMQLSLKACAGCSLCAESCFMFELNNHNPQYMPSYKVLHTLGKLYSTHGRVSREKLDKMAGLAWHNCVLCGRCYCPFGIDIPDMIAYARQILREQNIAGVYPHSLGAPEEEAHD